VTLGRLSKRQTREMIAAVSAERPLPETVIEELAVRADGIPLFAEELTQEVLEAGSGAAADTIPATLQDSLLARLDRLSSAKEVAERAAVLGREFSYALLAATAGLDDGALQQGLARLVEAEIVYARGAPPEATYTFKHALMQEAAYALLLKRTRQQLHGRVADVLVSTGAAAPPEMIAHHAEMAGRTEDAIAHLRRAGEQAQRRSAHAEAIDHLRHAIALLTALPVGRQGGAGEIELQLALGGSLQAARGYAHPEVEDPYDRARVLAEAADDSHRLGLALIGLMLFHQNRGDMQRARTLAARALTTAERSGDAEVALHGHIQVAILEYYEGNFASALAHLDAARVLYEPGRDDATASMFAVAAVVTIAVYEAWNLWALGTPDRALGRARDAVALARRLDHPFSLANALLFESAVHWWRRDSPSQTAAAAEAIALCEQQGFPLWLAGARMFHAAARVADGEPGAVADLLDGLAAAGETGNQVAAPALFALLAEAQATVGRLDDVHGILETGLAVAVQTGQHFYDAELHRLKGEIVLRTAEGSEAARERTAAECFQQAIHLARAQGARSFELRAATSLARLWHARGEGEAARDCLGPCLASFSEGFDTPDVRDARALLDDLDHTATR
jgi:tetratricopeptide (TPR) repeat protein